MDCQDPDLDRGIHPASGARRYRAFGLDILSEVELPHLPGAAAAEVDLAIVLGEVEPSFRSVAGYRRGKIFDQFRYEAVDGGRIVVEPLPGANPVNIADGLMSRVITIALYQRGMLPLHASAASIGGRTIAICGRSGAGKSTLAAMLADLGGTVVSDDMLVLAVGGEACGAWSGAIGLKLSTASLAAVGLGSDGLRLANSVEGKYFLPGSGAGAQQPVAVTTLVCLGDGAPRIERLSSFRAASEWNACVKMPELVEVAPDRDALWRRWLGLLGATEVLLVSHGRDMSALRRIAERLADGRNLPDFHDEGCYHGHTVERHAGCTEA